MYCINCGKQLPDNSKFCSGCGTALSQAALNKPKNVVSLDGESILSIVLSIIIVLAVSFMDFFEVDLSNTQGNTPLTILSIFGKESYTSWGANSDSSLHSIMMLFGILLIATATISAISACIQKCGLFCAFSCINSALTFVFNMAMQRNTYIATPQIGYSVCVIASILLAIVSIISYCQFKRGVSR